MRNLPKSLLGHYYRQRSQGEMIESLLQERAAYFGAAPVFVETGCGISTISLAKFAKGHRALVYSLDYSSEKIDELKSRSGDQVYNVEFVVGDSLESLRKIVEKHKIDFLFLDSAASATHTFREFLIAEPAVNPQACLLVDNAALPGPRMLLSPVRKGKILVHYLLASPHWEVRGHPRAGDSMVSAVRHKEPDFADPRYEDPEYIDNWRKQFDNAFK